MSLPSGYKRLEYIQSTGTQYVDAGFKPTGSTKVVCDFQMLNQGSSQQGVFGSRPGISGRFTVFTGQNGASDLQVDYNTEQTLAHVGNSITGLNVNSRTTLEVSNSLVINGTTVKTVSAASFTSTYNLFLFANNNAGTAQLPGILKLYSCQIYDNGTLVRDFIPCQTTAGEIGLWDDVNSVFYGNAGTGTFTAGPVIAISTNESEITELEYIQSSGTQYIDTGFKPNQNTRVVLDYSAENASTSSGNLFGADSGWTTKAFDLWIHAVVFAASYSSISQVTSRVVADLNKGTLTRGGSTLATLSGTFQADYNLTLFGLNRKGSVSEMVTANFYSCKIYDNGTLIRDYISAKLYDGTVGLYDKLHGLLYINVGSGVFTAGPEVSKAPSAPSGFTAVRLTDTAVQLNWTASDGATGYNLYKNDALLAALAETSYTDTVQVFSSAVYAVTAYNDDGESEAVALTYYSAPDNPILYLVTNRTAADVAAQNAKGTYTAVDLNRVGEAMNYVADRLRAAGYDPHINPKTDWKYDDWVDTAAQAVYLGDLAELRKQFAMMKSTPEVPPRILATGINTNDGLTHTWANNIEQILLDIDALLTNIAAGWLYSGEIYSGEV